jgi:hypothetical protein
MKEALIKCMEYLFNNGFENIIYGYTEGNTKSQRLSKKLGFEPYKQFEEGNYLGNISTTYQTIMSKEKFFQSYSHQNTKCKKKNKKRNFYNNIYNHTVKG